MPNRILKESICASKGLSECSVFAEDLYKRLIVYADDYGRFNADTEIMLARLYPRELQYITEDDIIEALIELAGTGKVAFYTSQPRKDIYGCLPKWAEHQRIRTTKSKCPDPDDATVNDWYLRRFVSIDLREKIISRDNFKCQICGKYLTTMRDARRFAKLSGGMYHIDHIIPVLQGGRATEENLRLTCPACNQSRKKRFSMEEIIDFTLLPPLAADCGKPPQTAAIIQSNPNPNPNPIHPPKPPKGGERASIKTALFDEFWAKYPRKVGKGDARKAWDKLNLTANSALVDVIFAALEKQKGWDQWQREGGRYIPHPATWLNQQRWEDEGLTGIVEQAQQEKDAAIRAWEERHQ